MSVPLTQIIDLTSKTGKFLNKLKLAEIIPIFKSGDRSDINNYRPISVPPNSVKLLKK